MRVGLKVQPILAVGCGLQSAKPLCRKAQVGVFFFFFLNKLVPLRVLYVTCNHFVVNTSAAFHNCYHVPKGDFEGHHD